MPHSLPFVIGKHAIIDLAGCDPAIIRDHHRIQAILTQAAQVARLTVVGQAGHEFTPEGYSMVLVLEESHLSIHTWPEYNFISLDLYSCNLSTDFVAVQQFLADQFKAQQVETKLLERHCVPLGLPQPLPSK